MLLFCNPWCIWYNISLIKKESANRPKHTLHKIAWNVWSIHYQRSKTGRIHHIFCKPVSISDSSNFLGELAIHTSTDSLPISTHIISCTPPRQTTNTSQKIYIRGLKMLLISPPRGLWCWSPWSTPSQPKPHNSLGNFHHKKRILQPIDYEIRNEQPDF